MRERQVSERGGGLGVCRIGTGGRDNRDYVGGLGHRGKEKNQNDSRWRMIPGPVSCLGEGAG